MMKQIPPISRSVRRPYIYTSTLSELVTSLLPPRSDELGKHDKMITLVDYKDLEKRKLSGRDETL